jgi:hypothetical protein
MKLPSLEDIAMKWSLAHTVALAAWVIVAALGVALFVRHTADPYPATDKHKMYAAENATFTYPQNWTINACVPGHSFIELPGTIKGDYKGRQAYGFTIIGSGAYACSKDRPERLDLYAETFTASDNPCAPATSTKGERLDNGLYLHLAEHNGEVYGISIHQNSCFAPEGVSVLTFSLMDPQAKVGDTEEYGPPRIKQEAFLVSRQYQDIKALVESIRY